MWCAWLGHSVLPSGQWAGLSWHGVFWLRGREASRWLYGGFFLRCHPPSLAHLGGLSLCSAPALSLTVCAPPFLTYSVNGQLLLSASSAAGLHAASRTLQASHPEDQTSQTAFLLRNHMACKAKSHHQVWGRKQGGNRAM